MDLFPELRDILCSNRPIPAKRSEIKRLMANLQDSINTAKPHMSDLEIIMAGDAAHVFSHIISHRNEKSAGYSFLNYLNELLNTEGTVLCGLPSRGFVEEIRHLMQAMSGNSPLYKVQKQAADAKSGLDASQARSEELSEIGAQVQVKMKKYSSGLDREVQQKRQKNTEKILNHFNASPDQWREWQWHIKNSVNDPDTLNEIIGLSDEEFKAVKGANQAHIPFGITPYYLSLLGPERARPFDEGIRAQVIPTLGYIAQTLENIASPHGSMDFMRESETSPIEGVTRRYPMILILKPVLTCPQICVYCQRNWEIEDINSAHAALPKEKLDKAIKWIADTPEIREVLITGGDPLILSDKALLEIIEKIANMQHVERIRIGTRTPVTLPQRITDDFVSELVRFHEPGKREICIITHFESQLEITPFSVEAVQRFKQSGLDVYNQLVYTFFTSRRFQAADLRNKLRLAGVTPYYTFNTKGKDETKHFRVPIARLLQEQKEEARLMPGTVRTDEVVFNVPRLGKNYLRARQHHDLISILPDGRRVYKLHPWEKKITSAETYTFTDVSIHDYIQRLVSAGENASDYQSIWYYY